MNGAKITYIPFHSYTLVLYPYKNCSSQSEANMGESYDQNIGGFSSSICFPIRKHSLLKADYFLLNLLNNLSENES